MLKEFENEKSGLLDMINDLRAQNKDYRKEIKKYSRLEKEEVTRCDVGVQLRLEDLSNFAEFDDITNYFTNLNSFIIEGKKQNTEWAMVIITDILNSKLIADYHDFKKG